MKILAKSLAVYLLMILQLKPHLYSQVGHCTLENTIHLPIVLATSQDIQILL